MRGVVSVLLVAACTPTPPPVGSCDDDLSGIWGAADGRRFHLVERKDKVEVYPLFDPSPAKERPPWRTPPKTELVRAGAALAGKTTIQVQGDRLCTIVTPARLEGCGDDRAQLVIDFSPEVDLETCTAAARAAWGL